jgi:uncharacterized protein YggE
MVALVVFSTLVSATTAASESNLQPATIRVEAQAMVSVAPDQAEVDLGVTTDKKTATEAVAENDQKMMQVLAALKKTAEAPSELKTSELRVSPRFEEDKDGRDTTHLLGYRAINTVRVRVSNTKSVGKILDVAVRSGANTVERVAFTLKDPDGAQREALRNASSQARTRATAIAEGQGLRVGDVLSMTEGDRFLQYGLEGGGEYFSRRDANIIAMPIESGSVQVRATVTVIFALIGSQSGRH